MSALLCLECGENVNLGPRPRMGQRVVCRHCRTPLLVTWLSPLELDWADEIAGYEDGDDDYDRSSRPWRNQRRRVC